MSKYVTLIEIGRKQKYIFSSNRLSENIGASLIIKNATEKDARKFYDQFSPFVIYEGGGNALYVFNSKKDGIEFAKGYSTFLLKNYPGLTLYLVGKELDEDMTVKHGINECYILLAKKKNQRFNSVEIIDYGNTVRCATTNLPAVPHDGITLPKGRQEKPISAESLVKFKASQDQNIYYNKMLPEGFKFPLELDELGRSSGDKSYIAIVHIDGNRMGNKIKDFNEGMEQTKKEDREQFDSRYMKELGLLSESIRKTYEDVFEETIAVIAQNITTLSKKLSLSENNLPIRPLILAGDDICFVTDGRIGIETAKIFLNILQNKKIKDIEMHACGGVAIVKSHFPFSRAYDLAEELCQNAKNAIADEEEASFIDWHIEQGELQESLYDIRNIYNADDGTYLTMKPYRITNTRCNDSFSHFEDALKMVSSNKIARSKIKGMRDIAHKGKKATEYYLKSNQIVEDLGQTDWLLGDYGFINKGKRECHIFYDALEMIDVYERMEN